MTTSSSVDLISLVVAVLVIIFIYYKWSFQYWKKKNVPCLDPRIPFGNVAPALLGEENFGITIKKIYHEMRKKGMKHGGIYIFTSPNYIPVNLEYVQNIMTKDFEYFTDRSRYYNEEKDPLDAHLVNLCGLRWKNLRAKLSPTFTSGKMKMMFQTVAECHNELLKKVGQHSIKREPIDVKQIFQAYTTDVIGSCAFGLSCKSLQEENSPFKMFGKKFFNASKFKRMLTHFCFNFPKIATYLNISITSKDITQFFTNIVKEAVDYRESNNYFRNDFMQLLIEAKNKDNLTIEEVVCQCFVIFLAGFETNSSTMSFILYELSKSQEIQQKVRDEIEKIVAQYDGEITYEGIKEMKYLDQVIDETLRMYPPFPVIDRRCVKDYKIPNEDVVIEKGTTVLIPSLGIHYDEEYYPDPTKFDPERFTEENVSSRNKFAHHPFGDGPRVCIGMRFAQLQLKLGLSCLIKDYKFTLNRRTPQTLKIAAHSFILSADDEIWLDAQKI